MGKLLKSNQTCPNCGSGRGLAVYDDNEHCFSCDYHRNFRRKLKHMPENIYKEWGGKLPYDIGGWGNPLPKKVDAWLSQYWTREMIDRQALYSPGAQRLIFPIRYNSHLKGYQARAIDREPKWLSYSHQHAWGKKFPYVSTWKGSDEIVIVEDIISAMKVAQVNDCISLLGCKANRPLLNFIAQHGTRFVVWLDNDKAGIRGRKLLMKQLALIGEVR